MPNSISANYSQTNGERKYVDSPTTFLIGDGSNLKVGKVEYSRSNRRNWKWKTINR